MTNAPKSFEEWNRTRNFPAPDEAQEIIFEGYRCVVMDPEGYAAVFEQAEAAAQSASRESLSGGEPVPLSEKEQRVMHKALMRSVEVVQPVPGDYAELVKRLEYKAGEKYEIAKGPTHIYLGIAGSTNRIGDFYKEAADAIKSLQSRTHALENPGGEAGELVKALHSISVSHPYFAAPAKAAAFILAQEAKNAAQAKRIEELESLRDSADVAAHNAAVFEQRAERAEKLNEDMGVVITKQKAERLRLASSLVECKAHADTLLGLLELLDGGNTYSSAIAYHAWRAKQ